MFNQRNIVPLIDPQLLNDCAVNARTVSHNQELVVIEGRPGGGSYLISGEGRFVLDPEHCSSRTEAIWTACHEGMHEWQTPGFSTLPLTQEQLTKLARKIGFAATRNIIEDCAGNDGMVRSHIGLAVPTVDIYRKNLENAGGVLNHPEIMQVMQQIGREPKFARALALILDAWAEFRVSSEDFFKKLSKENGFNLKTSGDRDVDQVMAEAFLPLCVTINQTLITGQEERPQVRAIGINRFTLTKDYLYPLIERLVKLDINQEQQNQAAQKALDEGKLSDKAQQEISKQRGAGQQKQDASNDGDSQSGEQQELSNSEQGTSAQQGDSSALQQDPSAAGKTGVSGNDSDQSIEGGQAGKGMGDPSPTQPGETDESVESTKGGGNDPLDTENPQTLNGASDGQDKETGEDQEHLPKPIDVSKLSDDTRREIADYLDGLSQDERDKIDEQVKKILQDLDDAIAKVFKPKTTDDDSVPSHQLQNQIAEEKRSRQQATKQFGSFSKAIRDASLKASTPYQRIFMGVAAEIERVEESVRHIFIPEENEEWRGAFASGQRLNIRSALRYEADPGQYGKLFDRRDLPTSFSYEFDLLIDRSGSMSINQKFEQTKKVAVFLIELLSRFDIPCSVRVFDDSVKTVKKWSDDASDPIVQGVIAESFLANGGTNDALAIGAAYREAMEREEKYKFILVLSDAESGVGGALRAVLEKVQSEGKVVLFHFGIGPNTCDTHGFYPHSRGDLPIAGKGAFFEVFTEVLEDLILNPAKYKGNKK